MEDQFVTQERRWEPEGPWRRLTPSLPEKIEVVKNQWTGTDVIITPTPVNTALQIKDEKGDGQRMVANVDEIQTSDCVPTPHDENVTTQQPEGVTIYH